MLKSSLLALIFPFLAFSGTPWITLDPFHQWSLDKAVKLLNDSPWARQETYTRVIKGVGSGISGEKEIYNTFYVRFLSARPVREAYARIQQIQHGYDKLTPEKRRQFEETQLPNLNMDVSQWIVISVSFRSNDPNEESSVRHFFQSETVETLKTKAFLSTSSFPQVELSAYYPQQEESIGAKFVFRREVDGVPVVAGDSRAITLELLGVPGTESRLCAAFEVKPMMVGNQLVF